MLLHKAEDAYCVCGYLRELSEGHHCAVQSLHSGLNDFCMTRPPKVITQHWFSFYLIQCKHIEEWKIPLTREMWSHLAIQKPMKLPRARKKCSNVQALNNLIWGVGVALVHNTSIVPESEVLNQQCTLPDIAPSMCLKTSSECVVQFPGPCNLSRD